MSKLLIDEAPVYFAKTLAKHIGLEKAIILQQVHFWLEINKREEKNYYEDRYWVYSSFEQWAERDFNWWSQRKLISLFCELCDSEILIKKQLKKEQMDRTNFYTINYEKLNEIYKKIESEANESRLCKICNIDIAKSVVSNVQDLHDHKKQIKLEENKYIYNIHKSSSSIDIERLKKTEIKDDDDENPNINFPSIFEIKKFISKLKNNNPEGDYISAQEYYSKMTALDWTLNGKQIKDWKAYYIRCCDNKQFRVDIENQKIKKGKSYDFTTSGNKTAYDRLLKNAS